MDGPSVPKPRMTAKGIALAGCFWAMYALLYALLIAQSEGIPFVWALSGQTVATTFLALYSVPVWWLTVRAMDDWHGGWVVGAHLVIGPLYAWGSLESYTGLLTLLAGPDVTQSIETRYGWIIASNGTVYAIQFAIYHLVRSTHRLRIKEQQAAELQTKAREQELAALKAQVNPHFLFNTLNSISAAVTMAPEHTRDMIARLSELLRYALAGTQRNTVSLRDEVQFAEAYLELEAHRFSDRLQVTVDVRVNDAALDAPVPPMVLQPLVENAVKHGIAPSETGGTVTVRIAPDGERIQVTVIDTGVGPDTDEPLAASTGLGLTNTDQRLRRTFGPEAALHAAPHKPQGFAVWFSIPRPDDPQSEDYQLDTRHVTT